MAESGWITTEKYAKNRKYEFLLLAMAYFQGMPLLRLK
jgi:hypothetical protein